MLAHLLAIAVASGSLGFYGSLFLVQSVYRSKSDFVWCGLGLFYALVLWVCAGRITGGVLLGQTASVALLGWLGWQTFNFRRTVPLNAAPEPPLINQDSVIGRLIRRFRQAPTPEISTPAPTPTPQSTESSSPTTTEGEAAIAPEAESIIESVEPKEPTEAVVQEPETAAEPESVATSEPPQTIAPPPMPVVAPKVALTPAEESDLATCTVSSLLDLAARSISKDGAIAPTAEPESVEDTVSSQPSPHDETGQASDESAEEAVSVPPEQEPAASEVANAQADAVEPEVSTSFADRIVAANFDPEQEDIVDVEVLSSSPAKTEG